MGEGRRSASVTRWPIWAGDGVELVPLQLPDQHVGVARRRRAPATERLAAQLPETREQAGLEGQVVLAVVGDHRGAIAVLAELEGVTPGRGAIHTYEQPVVLGPS